MVDQRTEETLGRPDGTEEAGFSSQTVDGVIAFTLVADKPREDKGLVLAGNEAALGVDLDGGDLDRRVVLGRD